jgi:protein-S-isoprenylcysteine O-methyltransferase Ste14
VKGKSGEHPFGDTGQLVCLGLFMIVWAADSFFLRLSTGPSDSVPLFVRRVFSGLLLLAAMYMVGSVHRVVSREKRPDGLVTSGAFRYVRHPLYLGGLLFYLGLTVSTGSLLSLGLLAGILFFYHLYRRL